MWELCIGDIKGALSLVEASLADDAFTSFGVNFKDPFNAPSAEFAIPSRPDANWYKISVGSIDFVSTEGDVSLHALLPDGIRLDTNDLARDSYRRVTSIRLPGAVVRCLRHSVVRSCWVEVGELSLDAAIDMYSAPIGWRETAEKQAIFISEQDEATGRLLGIARTKAYKWTPAPRRLFVVAIDRYADDIVRKDGLHGPASSAAPL